MTADQFVDMVSRLSLDGECEKHGEGCDLASTDCYRYEQACDDAIDALQSLIRLARSSVRKVAS